MTTEIILQAIAGVERDQAGLDPAPQHAVGKGIAAGEMLLLIARAIGIMEIGGAGGVIGVGGMARADGTRVSGPHTGERRGETVRHGGDSDGVRVRSGA